MGLIGLSTGEQSCRTPNSSEDSREISVGRALGRVRERAARASCCRRYGVETRGKKLRAGPIVGTVRTGARGADESTQGDGEREEGFRGRYTHAREARPRKTGVEPRIWGLLKWEGDTGGWSQAQTLNRSRRVGLRTQ